MAGLRQLHHRIGDGHEQDVADAVREDHDRERGPDEITDTPRGAPRAVPNGRIRQAKSTLQPGEWRPVEAVRYDRRRSVGRPAASTRPGPT
jgi:hypothetical protein